MYNESSIRAFEGVEAVRERPGMYLGVGAASAHQCFYEIFANSLDEAIGGFAKKIDIILNKKGIISVEDDGRGIPWKPTKFKNKMIPACIKAATDLHAGGKFDDKAYAISAGTNGVGLTSVNAVSQWFRLETTRDNATYFFECEEGKISKNLTKLKNTRLKTGTKIYFQLDPKILKDTKLYKGIPIPDSEGIKKSLKISSYLNPGLKITFIDEINNPGKKLLYHSKNGLIELIEKKNNGKKLFEKPFQIKGNLNNVNVEIAFNWGSSHNEWYETYANGILTSQGGTHLTGFRLALSKCINQTIEKLNLLEGKNKNLEIISDDIREGMIYAISVKLKAPQFHSQTKDSLGNREAQGATQKLTNDFLNNLFETNQKIAKIIAMRTIAAARGRIAAKKAREVERKEVFDGTNISLPSKLSDCLSNNPEDTELFIVEG